MKNKKTWLILSLSCIVLGILLTAMGALLGGIPGFYLDKSGIHTSREAAYRMAEVYQDTRELEAFDSLNLQINYADVMLIPSDRYAVDYRITGSTEAPVCQVENGTLTFFESAKDSDSRLWFLYTDPGSEYVRELTPGSYYVKIEYPAELTFSDITIRSMSGALTLPVLQADTLDLLADYGEISLDGYTGQKLTIQMSSGDLSAGSVKADRAEIRNEYGYITLREYEGEDLSLRMSSGNLILDDLKTGRAKIQNEYGDIQIGHALGTSLTTELSYGDFLTDSLDFTELSVRNEYGLVCVNLAGDPASYGYQLRTEYGHIRMDGRTLSGGDEEDGVFYSSENSGEKTVEIFCENGDIIIALLSYSL